MTEEQERRRIDPGDGNTDSGPELTGGYGGSTGVGSDVADPGSPADQGEEGRSVSTDPDALGSTAAGPSLTSGGTDTAIPEDLVAHANFDDPHQ